MKDIKQSTLGALHRYAEEGIPTGGFLRAVLSNDLREAFGRADMENRATLYEIVSYCYNELPGSCWGSPERYEAWIAKHAESRAIAAAEGEE